MRPRSADSTEETLKTVVRIIARLNVGGPAVHCTLLSEGLNQHGYRTVLIAGLPSEGEADYLSSYKPETSSYRLCILPTLGRSLNPWADWVSFRQIVQILRQEQPSVVHTHTAKAGLLGRLAAWWTGVPVVVHTFHGHVLRGYFSKSISRVLCLIERGLSQISTAVVTLSDSLKKELSVDLRVVPDRKIHVVPLGRDLGRFLATPRHSGKLRKELGLRSDLPLFGIVGRLVPIKNHELLLQACAKLPEGLPWSLVVVGEGPLGSELAEKSKKLRISEKVHFLGWRTDLEELYSDLDFSILTSLNEGTPLSSIESFASGCPVIMTDVGGCRDLFSGQGNARTPGLLQFAEGQLVTNPNVETVAKAIEHWIRSRALAEACSPAARERANAFSIDRLLSDIAGLYRRELLLSGA